MDMDSPRFAMDEAMDALDDMLNEGGDETELLQTLETLLEAVIANLPTTSVAQGAHIPAGAFYRDADGNVHFTHGSDMVAGPGVKILGGVFPEQFSPVEQRAADALQALTSAIWYGQNNSLKVWGFAHAAYRYVNAL